MKFQISDLNDLLTTLRNAGKDVEMCPSRWDSFYNRFANLWDDNEWEELKKHILETFELDGITLEF